MIQGGIMDAWLFEMISPREQPDWGAPRISSWGRGARVIRPRSGGARLVGPDVPTPGTTDRQGTAAQAFPYLRESPRP